MTVEPRFFVKLFERDLGDRMVLADMIEVPNEETARYVAKAGALDRVGTAAVVTGFGQADRRVVLLVAYGSVPPKADLLAMDEMIAM